MRAGGAKTNTRYVVMVCGNGVFVCVWSMCALEKRIMGG